MLRLFECSAYCLAQVSMCYLLYQKPSVAYWLGNWEIYMANGVVIWSRACACRNHVPEL